MGGMTCLLLLLWAGVTVSTAVDLQKRIIGGHPCTNNERWYHVKFINKTDGLICGGSLISKQWILTAAHCWKEGMRAVVGVHPLQGQKPVEITEHKIYEESKKTHDIMLLKLPKASPFPTIALPDCKSRPAVGDAVQVAGYGPTTVNPDGTKVSSSSLS
uniref:serine protease 1-like n=1 Tax=Semicossyphus pulcher TaxID=241346 RepID=UPI0037E7B8A9